MPPLHSSSEGPISSPPAIPQDNPILSAYERFVAETPFVTRMIINILVVSYLASYLVDLHYAMACIPQFMFHYYEIYRLVTSILVNPTLMSVLLAGFSFVQTGARLEEAIGSAAAAWLGLVIFTLGTNLLFVAGQCLRVAVTGDSSVWLHSAAGMWGVLLGWIAVECGQAAPYQATRRWLVFNVPTLYYPLAMSSLFSLLSGGFHLSDTISLALGYGLGKGKLDFLKVPSRHVKALEESNMFLNSRLRQIGWVGGPAARGAAAWSQLEPEPLGGRQVGLVWMLLLFVVCCLLFV